MKMIFRSLFVIAAVAAIAGAGTYSLWSSQALVSGSTFSTGTMNLKVDANPASDRSQWESSFTVPQDYFVKDLYPGYPTDPGYARDGDEQNWQIIDIKNVGSISGYTTIKIDATAWSTPAIADNLIFTIYYDGTDNGNFTNPAIATGPLSAWNHNTYQLGQLDAGKVGQVKVVWSVPTEAPNDIQGASVTLDTTFSLNQVANQVN